MFDISRVLDDFLTLKILYWPSLAAESIKKIPEFLSRIHALLKFIYISIFVISHIWSPNCGAGR